MPVSDNDDPYFDTLLVGGLDPGLQLRGRQRNSSPQATDDPDSWHTLTVATDPDQCDHTDTVCAECSESWSLDWELQVEATVSQE